MFFVIKAAIDDPNAATFDLPAQKTMYGGKHIAAGDTVFVFSSETEGGPGLIAHGTVHSAELIPRRQDMARQTPRVSVIVRPEARATRPLGRNTLKHFRNWDDGTPESELNFKLYRQATNKIAGISERAASFLQTFF